MKFLIVKKETLEVMGMYESDHPDTGKIIADFEMEHVPVPDGLDPRHAIIQQSNNSYTAVDSRTYRSSHNERIEFGEKLIKDFMAANNAAGMSEQVSYQVTVALLPMIVMLKIGSLPTALYGIKNIPDSMIDGVFVTEQKLLYFANEIEKFLGLPLSVTV